MMNRLVYVLLFSFFIGVVAFARSSYFITTTKSPLIASVELSNQEKRFSDSHVIDSPNDIVKSNSFKKKGLLSAFARHDYDSKQINTNSNVQFHDESFKSGKTTQEVDFRPLSQMKNFGKMFNRKLVQISSNVKDSTSSGFSSSSSSLVSLPNPIINDPSVPPTDQVFLINGWRWHSRAVLRDVSRFRIVANAELENLMKETKEDDNEECRFFSNLPACYDFLWSFSWKALHNIESKLYYPWLRKNLPIQAIHGIDQLELSRGKIAELGYSLGVLVEKLKENKGEKEELQGKQGKRNKRNKKDEDFTSKVKTRFNNQKDRLMTSGLLSQNKHSEIQETIETIRKALSIAEEMEWRSRELVTKQEAFVVPYVAAYVDSASQNAFNNKVIASLGVLNSRLHLVSMYEAIRDVKAEYEQFKAQIPSVAQYFLPRWREKLYLKRTKCFEF